MGYTVYMHTTPNGKVYIGITSMNPNYRWNHGDGYKKNSHFYNAIKKYGWDNIRHKIIASGLSKEDACNLEIQMIAAYNSNDPAKGYNKSTGGEVSALGCKHTDEYRMRLSKSKSGEKNPMFGKHHSEKSARKISEALKGKFEGSKNPSAKAVVCIETGRVFPTMKDAQTETGILWQGISHAVRGVRQTAGGYHWKYYCGEEQHEQRNTDNT